MEGSEHNDCGAGGAFVIIITQVKKPNKSPKMKAGGA